MRRASIGALIVLLAAASFNSQSAQAQRIRTGVLNCDVSAGIGLIIGSQRSVNCLFTPDQPGPQEGYFGTISKLGLDIGATAGGVMVWGVYADTTRGYGFLAGEYAGASGEVTIAAGLGANVLVGGSNRTVALQPVSIGGQIGFNLALGVANLSLRPSR
jgi:Protein of unknown function (DUF992)